MPFFILTFICGTILTIAPLAISRWIHKNWLLPKSIFWKAGLSLLIITVFYFSFIENLASAWADFKNLPQILQALVVGLATGLFIELGRFIVLDRIMKEVRQAKEGIYFGLGWGGFNVILVGLILIINTFTMNFLINTQNIKEQFPEATTQQIQSLEDIKKQAIAVTEGNPLVAFAPLVESASSVLFDIALTLVILFGLLHGQSRYTWLAVVLRSLMSAFITYATPKNILATELCYVAFGVLAILLIMKMRKVLN